MKDFREKALLFACYFDLRITGQSIFLYLNQEGILKTQCKIKGAKEKHRICNTNESSATDIDISNNALQKATTATGLLLSASWPLPIIGPLGISVKKSN